MYERRRSSCAAERRSRYGSNGKNVSSGRLCRDVAAGAARGSLTSGMCDEATARAAVRPGIRSVRDLSSQRASGVRTARATYTRPCAPPHTSEHTHTRWLERMLATAEAGD